MVYLKPKQQVIKDCARRFVLKLYRHEASRGLFATAERISTSSGIAIPWVDKVKYLGIFVVRSHTFSCDLDHAKKSFYRSANAIFGKVGRAANEEVVVQLLVSKCIPILMYGLMYAP